MRAAIPTLLSAATLATSSPILMTERQTQLPDTVYGVDPAKPFYLSATTADSSTTYVLQPYYYSVFPNLIGLQALDPSDATGTQPADPRANFTLTGNHYGTQLYGYKPAVCTSAGFCPSDPPSLQWSNDEPEDNRALTFHQGVDAPSFGGLAFYGAYRGGDFEAGEANFLVGAADTDLAAAFTVCDGVDNPSISVLAYHGTNSSCVPVTVRAVQVPDDN
ncbi:hypothetical protein F4778DRAFT_778799 [Xylariomycetidae sp. FL2044]|nr:hypothetical protein F4778DRAFT_778799 [Xylariomycetidae sp. FL2044]